MLAIKNTSAIRFIEDKYMTKNEIKGIKTKKYK